MTSRKKGIKLIAGAGVGRRRRGRLAPPLGGTARR